MADNIEHQDKGELVANRDQLVGVDNIEPLIKIIRGQQVMLDRDLATLYGVETKRLNEQVKRNIKRFPEDFMFQLTKDECLRSQIATLNEGRGQHLKYMPYVFTENGVAMLSSVLRSDTAIEVNIRIMRAFTSMRHFLQNNAEVFQRLSTMEYHQLEMQQHLQESDRCIEEVFRGKEETQQCRSNHVPILLPYEKQQDQIPHKDKAYFASDCKVCLDQHAPTFLV